MNTTAEHYITPKVEEAPMYSFGVPTLLLKTATIPSSPVDLTPSSNSLSFGAPTLLLGLSGTPFSESLSCANAAMSTSGEDTPIELNPLSVDDWGTGDDETALVSTVEDEDEALEDPSTEEILTRSSCGVHMNDRPKLVS